MHERHSSPQSNTQYQHPGVRNIPIHREGSGTPPQRHTSPSPAHGWSGMQNPEQGRSSPAGMRQIPIQHQSGPAPNQAPYPGYGGYPQQATTYPAQGLPQQPTAFSQQPQPSYPTAATMSQPGYPNNTMSQQNYPASPTMSQPGYPTSTGMSQAGYPASGGMPQPGFGGQTQYPARQTQPPQPQQQTYTAPPQVNRPPQTSAAPPTSSASPTLRPPNAANEANRSPSPKPSPKPPRKLTPMEQIDIVREELKEREAEVNKFSGKKGSREYLYLEEMLTRSLLKLDLVEANGDDHIRVSRKETVRNIQASLDQLELKALANETSDPPNGGSGDTQGQSNQNPSDSKTQKNDLKAENQGNSSKKNEGAKLPGRVSEMVLDSEINC